ncbi:HD domain-containing protein [Peptococcaceae bacterium]|nr:HD domain-containing protein [Peptococcaceae bacterium]
MLVLNSVKTLNIILDAKDNYTYKHSERVTAYAEKLARSLNVSSKKLKLLKYGAFLHDIGKVNIDLSILLKPGKLADEEFSIIKQHPIIGAEIVKKIEPLNNEIVISAILHHHERYDGKGYPHGLIRKRNTAAGQNIVSG